MGPYNTVTGNHYINNHVPDQIIVEKSKLGVNYRYIKQSILLFQYITIHQLFFKIPIKR